MSEAYSKVKGCVFRYALSAVQADDPPDILEKAKAFAAEEGLTDPLTIARIGWLILAERERCAAIAEGRDRNVAWTPAEIAAAIRSPTASSSAE